MTPDKLAAAGLRVKPLQWRGNSEVGWWKASDDLMLYRIRLYDGMPKPYRVSMDGFVTEWECDTIEAAKAAAQADYEARILAALDEVSDE